MNVVGSVTFCLLLFRAILCDAQCISDDSIRREIAGIQNEQSDSHLKINKLTALQLSYLQCHKKIGKVYAEIIHRLGSCYDEAGNHEQAIAYTSAAVRVNEHTGKPEPFLCNSYLNLGIFYSELNLIHQSDDCYYSCIAAGSHFPDKYIFVGRAYTQLAYSLSKAGDYQNVRDIAARGILFSRAAKDIDEEAALWLQKAQSEIVLHNFNDARTSLEMAISLLNGKNNYELASAYTSYAGFLNTTGQNQQSLVYYRKAFLLNKRLQNFIACADDLNNFGMVYNDNLRQENNARKCYWLGLQFAIKSKDAYQEAALYGNLGVTYWRENNFKKALIFYQKGLNILPIGFTNKSVTSNPDADLLSQVSNDFYESLLFANKGESLLALYKETSDKTLLKAALQTFFLASESVDMMRWKQSGELSKLHWRGETKEMYQNAIEVCYLLNDAESGFYFFEKSRSVLLNDQLNSSLKKNVTIDKNLKERLFTKMDSLNKQLISVNNNEHLNELKKEWLAVHQEWEDLQNQLNEKIYENTDKPDKSSISVEKQQQQLTRNKQSLVEYFNNDSVVYALLISPEKAKIYKIPYPSYLHDSGEFLKYCSNAGLLNEHYDRYVSLASKLYQKLFKPLQIDTKRVIISPAENFIPFDALLDDPHTDNSFLIKKYSFSYVYSMQVLTNQHINNTGQKTVFLGIAPENYAASIHLQPLTGSGASLERIQTGFGSSSLLQGEDAKKSRLLSQLPQSQIVQIYSHASADSTTRDPLLYMADSAVLMSEIQKLKCSSTDMVVLSACNTGIGYNAIGEGLFSLARGFRLAGIPSTVTNLWQADDKSTYELTESFYKYLKLGYPKDESLRLAKLAFLKNDQLHLLPFYWAPAIVLGDSSALHIPLNQSQHNYTWLLVSFAALLGCLCFVAYKRRNL